MAINVDYLNSNVLRAYPFTDAASGLDHNGTGLALGLIVDAVFVVDQDFDDALYLYSVENVDSELRLIITDSSDTPIFTVYMSTMTGDWAYAYAVSAYGYCEILCTSTGLDQALTDYTSVTTFLQTLAFLHSTQTKTAKNVVTLSPYNYSGAWATPGPLNTDVMLKGGYNTTLTDNGTVDSFREIRLSALAGAGLGQVPCAGAPSLAGTIKGLSPRKGAIKIEGDDCYHMSVNPQTGTITMNGLCQACCTCADYAVIVNKIAALADDIRTVKANLDLAHTSYQEGVAEFNDNIIPGISEGVSISVYSMRGSTASVTRLRLVIQVSNARVQDIDFDSWTLSFNDFTPIIDNVTIEDGPVSHTTSLNTVPAAHNEIDSGQSISITVAAHCTPAQAITGWSGSVRVVTTGQDTAVEDDTTVDWSCT